MENFPRTANGECTIKSGIIEECSMTEIGYYDLVLRHGTEFYELEEISSDTLQEGDYVKIAIPPVNYYQNVVKEINGKTTDYYKVYYGRPWIDKLWVGIYAFANLAIQLWFLKKKIVEDLFGLVENGLEIYGYGVLFCIPLFFFLVYLIYWIIIY